MVNITVLFLGLAAVVALVGASIPQSENQNHDNARIVMGGIAATGEFPWHVSIQLMAHTCSGVIIAPNWVLTVATCVVGLPETLTKIRYNSNRHNSGGTIVRVALIVVHPDFDRSIMLNNIALVRTQADFVSVKPVALAAPTDPLLTGMELIVSGWGIDLSTSGILSSQLKKVTMNTISGSDCAAQYDLLNVPFSSQAMICAGNLPNGGESICHGDFGGPAYQDELDKLYGVGSFAASCGEPGKPSVFTRVSRYREWIKQIAGV